MFHTNVAAGQKTASLIKKETDEHRTSNVQHRIRYSANLKKDIINLLRRGSYEGLEQLYTSNLVHRRKILRFACYKVGKA